MWRVAWQLGKPPTFQPSRSLALRLQPRFANRPTLASGRHKGILSEPVLRLHPCRHRFALPVLECQVRWRSSYPLPILNTLVPQTGQVPCVAGLPFLSVTGLGLRISRLVLHFMQYASISTSQFPNECMLIQEKQEAQGRPSRAVCYWYTYQIQSIRNINDHAAPSEDQWYARWDSNPRPSVPKTDALFR